MGRLAAQVLIAKSRASIGLPTQPFRFQPFRIRSDSLTRLTLQPKMCGEQKPGGRLCKERNTSQ